MNAIRQHEQDLDKLVEDARVKQFQDAGLAVPDYGLKYLCQTEHGTSRVLRYGYHRKNNPDNWTKPPIGQRPSLLWFGWRDDVNGRFLRFEEVTLIHGLH